MRYKLIITGAVGSGKTTAVNALSDKEALQTDVAVSDEVTSQRKQTTTVALDYGVVRLNDEDVVHVYGTPGQERFDFMWDILSEGADGLLLLIDNSRNYPFRDLKFYSEQFAELIGSTRLIVGVTRCDIKQEPSIETYQQWLKQLKLDAKVFKVDARNKDDIQSLVKQLFMNEGSHEDSKEIESDTSTSLEAPADELDNEQEIEELTLPPLEKMNLTRNSMQAVEKIQGVTGVSLTSDMGELIDSSINDESMNELIAFISGITPSLEEVADLGPIHRIMLRSPRNDNLTVFVEDERSLGVLSTRKTSIPALSQQIEDMLQWI